jgi:hypothetical protein
VRAAALLVSVTVATRAQADDRTSTSTTASTNFESLLEGVGAAETTIGSTVELGSRASAFVRARRWTNEIDASSSGWNIGAGLTRDLGGGFKLEVNGAFDHLDGRFGGRFSRGSAASVGARIVRYFRWSGGRVAWIAFGIETTVWFGEAKLAEPAGTFIGLHVGTTF